MENLPITIHGCRCLVIGFGRVGKLLSGRLRALGAKVTVAARRPADTAMIHALGMEKDVTGAYYRGLGSYELIINTVPALVLGPAELQKVKRDCLLIDLASKPGGIDLNAGAEQGLQIIWALSLPGRVAPVTAGYIIRDVILDYLWTP